MKRFCLVLFALVLSILFLTNMASAANVISDEYNTNNRFISNNNMNSNRYNPSKMTDNRYNNTTNNDNNDHDWG
ncbi:hypothetical protein ACFVR2_21190 [Gottfriedia sp. NPDC057991]|uniref:hypothetical protein n=1 Tax=Gottfriedia sp. NPDC057991 TaxID=3346298 RepID=UPI0036D9006F